MATPSSIVAPSAFMQQCNPGPRQRAYIDAKVMPTVAPAISHILSDLPAKPVHSLATLLRKTNPLSDDIVGEKVLPLRIPPHSAPIDKVDQYDTLTFHTRTAPLRPVTQSRPYPLPQKFVKAGPHPVYACNLPLERDVSSVVQHLVKEDGVKRIVWVVCGVGDLSLYCQGAPCRAAPSGPQWRHIQAAAGVESSSSPKKTDKPSTGSEWQRSDVKRLTNAAVKQIQQSLRAVQKQESERRTRLLRERALAAAHATGSGDVLVVVEGSDKDIPPLFPYSNLNPKRIVSIDEVLTSACELALPPASPGKDIEVDAAKSSELAKDGKDRRKSRSSGSDRSPKEESVAPTSWVVPHSIVYLSHPDDAVVTTRFLDRVTEICDSASDFAQSHGPTAVVLVAADRWQLLQHIHTQCSVYFEVQAGLQRLKRLVHVADATDGAKYQTFAKELAVAVSAKRRKRDEAREWLSRAHQQSLYENGEEEPEGAIEKRTTQRNNRMARRRRDDDKRDDIVAEQQWYASKTLQKAVRSYMLTVQRRKDAERLSMSGSAAAVAFQRREREGKEVANFRAVLKERYRDGQYPFMTAILKAIIKLYGREFVTEEVPRREATRQFRQYRCEFRRIEATDDLDVSSEEEEWTSEIAERVTSDVSSQFNPLHDTRRAMKLVGNPDLPYMLELFDRYGGLAALQHKALLCLERFASTVHYAAFLSIHHKKRLALELAQADVVAPSLRLTQLVKIPTKTQLHSSLTDFATANPGINEIINNAALLQPFHVSQPRLLHEPCANRFLLGHSSEKGSFPSMVETGRFTSDAAQMVPGVPFLFVPEHLTVEQWADTAAQALKISGQRRLLWLHTRPDPTVYVNEVPLYLVARPELVATDDPKLFPYSTIRNANINGDHPSIENGGTSAAARRTALARAGTPMQVTDVTDLDGPSPTRGPARGAKSGMVVKDPTTHLNPSWLNFQWDQLERDLAVEIGETIENADDGKLVIHCQSHAQFGLCHVQAIDTSLPDRSHASVEKPLDNAVAIAVATRRMQLAAAAAAAAAKDGKAADIAAIDGISLAPRSPRAMSVVGGESVYARSNLGRKASFAKGSVTGESRLTTPRGGGADAMKESSVAMTPGAALLEVGLTLAANSIVDVAPVVDLSLPMPPEEVTVKRHAIQVVKPKVMPPKTTSGMLKSGGGSSSQLDELDAPASRVPGLTLGGLRSGEEPADESTSFSVGGPSRRPVPKMTGRGFAAAAAKGNLRAIQGLRTQNRHSLVSSVAETVDEAEKEELQYAHLPLKGADATLSPLKAAEEVKAYLRKKHQMENVFIFRRFPVFRSFNLEWLRFLDQLYLMTKEQFVADPHIALVFGVSGPDSVMYGLVSLMVWLVEQRKTRMIIDPNGTMAVAEERNVDDFAGLALGERGARRRSESSSSSSSSESGTESPSDDDEDVAAASDTVRSSTTRSAGIPTHPSSFHSMRREKEPVSPFPVVCRLVAENKRLRLKHAVRFVDALLRMTNTRETIVGTIEKHMAKATQLAEEWPKNRSPNLIERDAAMHHTVLAARALERYILLVLFFQFATFVQEKQQVMSVMQLDFSFVEHITSHPHLLQMLEELNPFEGYDSETSPDLPFSTQLARDFRWRRRLWVTTIG